MSGITYPPEMLPAGGDDDEAPLIVVELTPEQAGWRPDPFPGGARAVANGCLCPTLQPWPGKLAFASDCPLHELERVFS